MGDKVLPCSVSNILVSWSRTVSRITCSCTRIQAESNKLFFIIIKRFFIEIFGKFQRHCFYSFPWNVKRQRLRDGPRHLLVINLMRTVRRSRCDSTAMLVTMVMAATVDMGHSWSGRRVISWEFINSVLKSNVQNCKASRSPTTETSLGSHRDHLHVTCAAVCRWNCSYRAIQQGVYM